MSVADLYPYLLIIAGLRALWLLPDWVAKWQLVFAARRCAIARAAEPAVSKPPRP